MIRPMYMVKFTPSVLTIDLHLTHLHSDHHLISLLGQPLGTMYNKNITLVTQNKKEKLETKKAIL